MITNNQSILNKDLINRLFDIPTLDRSIESTCQLAIRDPRALYLFMQRYVHFNGYAGSLVARLASSIGLSRDLFNNTNLDERSDK